MRGPGNGIGDRLQVTNRAARPRVESFQELPHLASHQQAFTTKIFGEKRRNVTEYSLGLMRAPLRDARRRRSAELQEEKLWGRFMAVPAPDPDSMIICIGHVNVACTVNCHALRRIKQTLAAGSDHANNSPDDQAPAGRKSGTIMGSFETKIIV